MMQYRACVRCGFLRTGKSYYEPPSRHPNDVCKPCIHHPGSVRKRAQRLAKARPDRLNAAVRYVVKDTQNGQPFVYLARSGGRFKIGTSTSVEKRMRQLSTGSSILIQLIAVAPGGQQLERELHKRFKTHHVRLEWFQDRNDEILLAFAALPGAMVFLPGYVTQDPPLSA